VGKLNARTQQAAIDRVVAELDKGGDHVMVILKRNQGEVTVRGYEESRDDKTPKT
jgi:phage terminase large subunit-like protein